MTTTTTPSTSAPGMNATTYPMTKAYFEIGKLGKSRFFLFGVIGENLIGHFGSSLEECVNHTFLRLRCFFSADEVNRDLSFRKHHGTGRWHWSNSNTLDPQEFPNTWRHVSLYGTFDAASEVRSLMEKVGSDTVRAVMANQTAFLLVGEVRKSVGWVNETGSPQQFHYFDEKCVASGTTREALLGSAMHYGRVSKMTWDDYFLSLVSNA